MTKIIVFDPGESTGWLYAEVSSSGHITKLNGGTLPRDHQSINYLIERYDPDIMIYETFQLYPGMAKAMSWSKFYPCEVIGVLKFLYHDLDIYGVQPSVKAFAGGFDKTWELFVAESHTYAPAINYSTLKTDDDNYRPEYHKITEHTKDTYLLLKHFLRNTLNKKK